MDLMEHYKADSSAKRINGHFVREDEEGREGNNLERDTTLNTLHNPISPPLGGLYHVTVDSRWRHGQRKRDRSGTDVDD